MLSQLRSIEPPNHQSPEPMALGDDGFARAVGGVVDDLGGEDWGQSGKRKRRKTNLKPEI